MPQHLVNQEKAVNSVNMSILLMKKTSKQSADHKKTDKALALNKLRGFHGIFIHLATENHHETQKLLAPVTSRPLAISADSLVFLTL